MIKYEESVFYLLNAGLVYMQSIPLVSIWIQSRETSLYSGIDIHAPVYFHFLPEINNINSKQEDRNKFSNYSLPS